MEERRKKPGPDRRIAGRVPSTYQPDPGGRLFGPYYGPGTQVCRPDGVACGSVKSQESSHPGAFTRDQDD